ncbi:MAG: SMC-Scp complex subunit ScpB [Actinobacteria bacterium]|nr:SMC-Scp complex subunit ScpB [Actinomycetota bacterium]
MVDSEAFRAVEAVLMVAVEPVPPGLLAELLEVRSEEVESLCSELARSYEQQNRGFILARVAGGYRIQSHPDMAQYVERFATQGVSAKLSAAALETLAIVAYKQPVSRAQITAVRGVNADGVVRMLVQRGYIEEVGHAAGPGQPALFGTTLMFLEKMGLDSLADLPPIGELVPGVETLEELEAGLHPGVDV